MKKVSKKDRAKKDREERLLNNVKSIYPDFPSGKITPLIGDEEPPDFLIISDERIIGIDVTDYMRLQGEAGSPIRHEEMIRKRIIYKARDQFETKHQIALQVNAHWHGPFRLSNAKRLTVERMATDITNLVERNTPRYPHLTEYVDEEMFEGTSLDGFIAAVSVTRLKPNARSIWSNIESGFPEVYSDELQDLISRKEEKLDSYLQKCSSAWLIIIADATHISSIADVRNEVSQHTFNTRFERVLFHSHPNQRILTLVNLTQ